MRNLFYAILTAVLLAVGIAAPVAAQASTRPVVYAMSNTSGWHGAQTRPRRGSIEQGTVQFRSARWRHWDRDARSRGARIWFCGPAGCTKAAGTITLSRRRMHNGQSYYRRFKVHMAISDQTFYYAFGKQGTRQNHWYQRSCSLHGGSC